MSPLCEFRRKHDGRRETGSWKELDRVRVISAACNGYRSQREAALELDLPVWQVKRLVWHRREHGAKGLIIETPEMVWFVPLPKTALSRHNEISKNHCGSRTCQYWVKKYLIVAKWKLPDLRVDVQF